MTDRQYDQAHELEILNQIGFLDDEEYWSYLILKGVRLAVVIV